MTPSTAAGRARMRVVSDWASGYPELVAREEDQVLAIEAEAVAAERARLAGMVRGLTTGDRLKRKAQYPESSYDPLLRESAVLALLDPQP